MILSGRESLWFGITQKIGVDMREDTSARDGRRDELVELLVTSNGQLQMSWSDSLDLEILGSVAREFQHFGREVLEYSGRVDCGGGSNPHVVLGPGLQEPSHSTDRELQASTRRVGDLSPVAGLFSALATCRVRTSARVCVDSLPFPLPPDMIEYQERYLVRLMESGPKWGRDGYERNETWARGTAGDFV